MGIASLLLQNKLQQDQAKRNWQSVQGLLGSRATAPSLGGHPGLQDVRIPGQPGSGLLENATSSGQENQLRLALRMATNPSMASGGNALLGQYFGQGPAQAASTLSHTRALEIQGNTIEAQNARSRNALQAAQAQRQADQAFQMNMVEYQKQLQAGQAYDNAQRNLVAQGAAQPWNDAATQRSLQAMGPRPEAVWPGAPQIAGPEQAPAAINQATPDPSTPQSGAPVPAGQPHGGEVLGYGAPPAGTKMVRGEGGAVMNIPMQGSPAFIKAQTEVDGRQKLVDIIGEMQTKLEDTGPDYVGASAKEYDALYAQFQASMAQLLELGVLQEGEAERLEERLPNPSSLASNFGSLPDTIRAGYAQVMKGAAADLERAKSKYKGWGLNAQPATGGWNQ